MKKRSDKGPVVARGARRSRGAEGNVRAKVLGILTQQMAANMPEPILLEAQKIYLLPCGPDALASFVGGAIRGGFSPRVTDSLLRNISFVRSIQEGYARGG